MEIQTEELITAADVPALVERYHATLVWHAERMVPGQGEDIVQAAWIRAWVALQRRPKISQEKVRPWLYRIVTNLAIDTLRHDGRFSWQPLDTLTSEPAKPGPEQAVEDRDEFERAVASLTKRRRQIAVLLARSYTAPEIAVLLGLKPNAVRQSLSRARQDLETWWQKERAG